MRSSPPAPATLEAKSIGCGGEIGCGKTNSDFWTGTSLGRWFVRRGFWPCLLLVVLAGSMRAWIATSRDGLQIDEAWHTVAGVSYARSGDFRLNPEHPPLVKLWIGASLPPGVFRLPPFRPLEDKAGEREFIDHVFYVENDPDTLQQRMRVSMLALHGILLLFLGGSLARVFGPAVALLGTGTLLIDPTIAAHLPVVLTDLPLTLLSTIAVLWAFIAFRSWRALDLLIASAALGLALGAKHSAIATALAIGLLGLGALWLGRGQANRAQQLRRAGSVGALLLGAYLVLWALYGFRFSEHPAGVPGFSPNASATLDSPLLFNRSLQDKIADLRSPHQRAMLTFAHSFRVLPRAYLWGLADIVRAGIEGRQEISYVFGKRLLGETPWYFFPAVLSVKFPIGTSLLACAGLFLLLCRRLPRAWQLPAAALLLWAGVFMAAIMRGNSGYAGVRHALPVFPVVTLLGALALAHGLRAEAVPLRLTLGAALAATLISALPQLRPWEYYNELVGGTAGAWRYFNDDGLDNGQRGRELADYYKAHLRGTNERVYDFYGLFDEERKAYGLTLNALEDDPTDSDSLSGAIFVNTRWLAPRPTYDYGVFREAEPSARFGNLLVFRGSYRVPWLRADRRVERVRRALDPGKRDPALAEQLLREITAIYPEDYRAAFELGNLLVERGATEPAIRAYALSRRHAPVEDSLVATLTGQIEALAQRGAASVGPLRNPWLE